MSFDWQLAFQSLAGGTILLISACLSRLYEKTVFAPATAMLLTWGIALVMLSFLPMIGFYHLSVNAVLLYVVGAGWFAFLALFVAWVLNQYSSKPEVFQSPVLERINYRRLLIFWAILALVAYPLAVANVLSYGSNIVEISYNIRRASVSGESILHPVVSNFFVIMGVLANIVLFGVVKNKVKFFNFLVLVAPLVSLSLVVSGRSGLVTVILGWLVIISIFSNGLKLRYLLIPIASLLLVLYFGGVWVKKFDLDGQSTANVFSILADHVFGYLYQGPILFSRYFDGDLDVATNWDFLNSACHLMSKLNMCSPLSVHQEFSSYGVGKIGNVYSIYFSIIPHYGLSGLVLVFSIYSIFLSVIFQGLRRYNLFSLAVYPSMFSAILLSVFADGIGYSFYWIIKVALLCVLIKWFFIKRYTY